MSCAIHHGGGVGTYKTFAVIQRHAIPELKKGRTVISTIRGFDSCRVIEAVLDIELHRDSKIIFVDLETTEGIEKIRRFWEWVPEGAFIIIDEAQLIYPKSKRVSTYDYPARDGMSSEQTAEVDNRPHGFVHAFTMQRHFNWDLVIITPNVKMLVPEIKEVSQVAYEHKYMGGLIPWAKHGWREIQHNPLETGKGSAHPPVRYTADRRIYKVYKSTKTGNHSRSQSERSIFANPKIISTFLIAIFALVVLFWLLFTKIFVSKKPVSSPSDSVQTAQVFSSSLDNNGAVRDDASISGVQPILVKSVETTRFHSKTMSIVGKFFDEYIIEVGVPPDSVQFTTGYLFNNGVKLKVISDCFIEMTFDDILYNVRCPLHRRTVSPSEESKRLEIKPFTAITGA